jgi:type IV secretory pathway TrbD component
MNIVYQSLQRPKLLRGGEWQLSLMNNLLAAGFVTLALMSWNWRYLLGAMFFGWPVQWLIRVLGRRDPNWFQIYLRANRQPLIREPHGCPGHRPSRPPRLLPKPNKFAM